jgi:hypothetical protein
VDMPATCLDPSASAAHTYIPTYTTGVNIHSVIAAGRITEAIVQQQIPV